MFVALIFSAVTLGFLSRPYVPQVSSYLNVASELERLETQNAALINNVRESELLTHQLQSERDDWHNQYVECNELVFSCIAERNVAAATNSDLRSENSLLKAQLVILNDTTEVLARDLASERSLTANLSQQIAGLQEDVFDMARELAWQSVNIADLRMMNLYSSHQQNVQVLMTTNLSQRITSLEKEHTELQNINNDISMNINQLEIRNGELNNSNLELINELDAERKSHEDEVEVR